PGAKASGFFCAGWFRRLSCSLQTGSFSMAEETLQDDIDARVIRVIAETQKIPADSVTMDKTFEDLKIDSLYGINIVIVIENKFNISIQDEGKERMRRLR